MNTESRLASKSLLAPLFRPTSFFHSFVRRLVPHASAVSQKGETHALSQ